MLHLVAHLDTDLSICPRPLAWVIAVAPGEPIFYCQRQLFCFVVFRLPRADQTGGEVQSGKLACMDEHHRLAARA